MPDLYNAADVCVIRAGAMTVAELLVAGVPAILVPLPGAPRDHQTRNAEALVGMGAAVLVPDPRVRRTTAGPGARCAAGRSRASARHARGGPGATATPTRRPASPSWSTPMPADAGPAAGAARPRRAAAHPRRRHRRSRHERHRARAAGHGPHGLGLGPEGLAGGGAPALPRHHGGGGAPARERGRRRRRHLLARGAAREPRAGRGARPGHPGRAPLRDAGRHLRHPALPGRVGHAREDDDGLHAVADPRRGGTAALLRHRGRRQRDRDQRRVGLRGSGSSSRRTRATGPSRRSAPTWPC